MKRIDCNTGDGSYMMVPNDVKAIWDLMVAVNGWTINVANAKHYQNNNTCYIDVFENENEANETRILDMYTGNSWPEARDLFIEWVRNGCEPGRVGYD